VREFVENLTKYLDMISKRPQGLFNVIAGFITVILSIISLYFSVLKKSPHDLGWIVVLTLLIITSLFLVGVSFYEGTLYMDKKDAIGKSVDKERRTIEFHGSIIRYYVAYALFFNNYMALLHRYHKDFTDIFRKNMNEMASKTINEKEGNDATENEKEGNDATDKYRSNIFNGADKYGLNTFKDYQVFLDRTLNSLVEVLEGISIFKDPKYAISASIKQFNSTYTKTKKRDYGEIKVLTMFRNTNHNNSRMEREIREKEYSIEGNTAFSHCMKDPKGIYMCNNIDHNANNYLNENEKWHSYYNCATVVAIFCQCESDRYYFGFLACDAQNANVNNVGGDVFDDDMVQIIVSVANIIGIYLDNIRNQWHDVFPDQDFLEY
jgi:hypothetical protein